MADIDSSIYLQQKGPDLVGGLEQGLKLKDLALERQTKQAALDKKAKMAELFKSSTGPDGKLNRDAYVQGLGKLGYGDEALTTDRQFKDDADKDLQRKMNQLDVTSQIIGAANDDKTWIAGKQKAAAMGLDVSQIPDYFDPNLKKTMLAQTLKAKDQLDNQWREQEAQRAQANTDRDFGLSTERFNREGDQFNKTFGLQKDQFGFNKEKDLRDHQYRLTHDDKEFAYKDKELGIKAKEAEAKALKEKNSGDNLPLDQKETVLGLAKKNANKLSIANAIDAVMDENYWDKLPEDQKIVQGRSLLKVLNSQEGADAIGVDEAKRLGSLLEFQMGNFTQPGAFIGRDLDGFAEQARGIAKTVRDGVNRNQEQIDQTLGRNKQVDPDAAKYAQMHNLPLNQAAAIVAARKSKMVAGGQ